MKLYELKKLSGRQQAELCRRPAIRFETVLPAVREITAKVKAGGDEAVRTLTAQFDGAALAEFRVSRAEMTAASARVAPAVRTALKQAAANITAFHRAQLRGRITVQTMPGVTCFAEMRPIERVGLYIPGGSAPLPSTVLMLAIPAQLAGCREIVLATPPGADGSVADVILAAAQLCGLTAVYKIGGAQAVAAMAYGTASMPKVDKLFGPGNQYVTAAKLLVSTDPDGAAIDMPAGPTELLVIADAQARADFVASDLLSQAEHGPDSQVVLVCTSRRQATAIGRELEAQLRRLPRRAIAAQALAGSFSLVVSSVSQAIAFANRYAPEHLILNTVDAEARVAAVTNAGSVFLGPYSCEAAGDYASGTNHALPTYGYARAYGGVSVASFQKQLTFQTVTAVGARNLAPIVTTIAAEESLEGHRRAMELRL